MWCRADYRGTFLVYAALVALWVPLCFWVEPKQALRLGQVMYSFLGCILPHSDLKGDVYNPNIWFLHNLSMN